VLLVRINAPNGTGCIATSSDPSSAAGAPHFGAVDPRTQEPSLKCTRTILYLDMLGIFAEFETNLRRERQMGGIAKAKASGVYRGRKPSIDGQELRRLVAEG
jgi:DNA invertase Pin-like site-specific DNA recombinase